jgi:hypothetical protein
LFRLGVRLAPAPARRQLRVPDRLVGEQREVIDGLVADQAHRLLVAGLAEQALAGAVALVMLIEGEPWMPAAV